MLLNAVKYSPDGGAIDVALVGKAESLTITVKDCGIGIPDADLPKLFQSFSRGSNTGTIPGTVLGLYIAKSCVELHSGAIALTSQEHKGTTITIDLPKEPAAMRNICQPR